MKPNLMKLMYAGYWGGSVLMGESPLHVGYALRRVFDTVTNERRAGAWNLHDFEFRCYDAQGDLRLRVQYGWVGNGWRYEPVPVRKNTKLPRPGDVVYFPDGGYPIAA